MSADAWLLLALAVGAIVWVLILVEDLLWEHGIHLYTYVPGGITK